MVLVLEDQNVGLNKINQEIKTSNDRYSVYICEPVKIVPPLYSAENLVGLSGDI